MSFAYFSDSGSCGICDIFHLLQLGSLLRVICSVLLHLGRSWFAKTCLLDGGHWSGTGLVEKIWLFPSRACFSCGNKFCIRGGWSAGRKTVRRGTSGWYE